MKAFARSTRAAAARRRVKHAVFPVAGFGAGFLPATKACPKELLPIVDRPLIQYAVEEAAAAGLTRMILITGRHKRAIEDHFDHAYELERELVAREDEVALRELRASIPPGVTFSYVRQPDVSGLPDALRKSRPLIGEEPFCVVLAEDLIDADRAALAQLLDVFEEQNVSVVGAQRSAAGEERSHCFIAADLSTSEVPSARALVKVPPIGAASLPVAGCGRYVFTPALWDALCVGDDPALERSVRALMERERVFACMVEGRRFDCSSKLGYLEAQVAYARKRSDLWPELRQSLGPLLTDEPPLRERAIPALTSQHAAPPR